MHNSMSWFNSHQHSKVRYHTRICSRYTDRVFMRLKPETCGWNAVSCVATVMGVSVVNRSLIRLRSHSSYGRIASAVSECKLDHLGMFPVDSIHCKTYELIMKPASNNLVILYMNYAVELLYYTTIKIVLWPQAYISPHHIICLSILVLSRKGTLSEAVQRCTQGSKLAPAKRQWRVHFWAGD